MKANTTVLQTLFLAASVAWLPSASAAGFTMKLAHSAAPGESRDVGAHKMADLLNGHNSCGLKVQVYPSSQLGGSNDMIQLLQLGSVEATLLPASFLVGFQPLLGLLDLPYYLPDDPQKLLKVHHSQAMKDLLATTTSKGIVSLGIWHTGYKEWTGPRPMVKPEDFKGLTARVMPSQVLVEQNRLLGLQNVSMNFGETYSALQNGTIQAQDNPITLIYAMKFYEVQKYMTTKVHEQFGKLDILVNNAGIFPRVALMEMRESDWDSVLDINLKGTCFTTIAAAKYMIKDGARRGAIINITSQLMAGTVSGAHYSSSKGGIVSLTRSCALELAQYGIRVNAVAPGLTDTAQPRGGYSERQLLEKVQVNVPLGGKLLTPQQIARGVVFLASDEADGITGQVLHINGGSYLY